MSMSSLIISLLTITYIISFDIHPDFFGVRADYNLLEGKWVGRIYSLVTGSITWILAVYFNSVGIKRRAHDNVCKTIISSLLNSVLLRVKFTYCNLYTQTSEHSRNTSWSRS